ncbi:hypothetical protein HJC23_005087 [Cyclotella cryptica]|uniref:Ubiquitin-like domain-containing protein n=1 Tax=Cyclotella cryptica TaxID=29204 RepID=A0ABD3QEV0_9STRA
MNSATKNTAVRRRASSIRRPPRWLRLRFYVSSSIIDEYRQSDDRTLESYSINAGATIHMVLQLRGGAQC